MTKSPDKPGPEHRTQPRRRVLLSGKLVYGDLEMTIDCAISDLSTAGARIRLSGPEPLVDPAYLIDVRHGIAFKVSEVWREEAVVGLKFSDYYDLKDPPPELPRRVRALWIEQQKR
jgi:hypothetical protein